jgi:hypothetical protein
LFSVLAGIHDWGLLRRRMAATAIIDVIPSLRGISGIPFRTGYLRFLTSSE